MSRRESPWLTLEQVLHVTGGSLLPPSGKRSARAAFLGCSIDTRTIADGELFVPLPGTRVDGHEFVTMALEVKAAGSLVQSSRPADPAWRKSGKPVISVRDPLRALQDLGKHCRAASGIPVTAVTGSNGKTTTKEMIAAVLGSRYRVHKNRGNLNNHIGVPLTLTHLSPAHAMLVLEMGLIARGEIRELAGLSSPNVGVLTNAGAAHLASLGTVDDVALAKSELAKSLPRDGLLVLNRDDERLWKLNRDRPLPKKSYSLEHPDADLVPTEVAVTTEGGARFKLADGTEVRLKLLGRHNVRNALAAILVGDHFGVSRAEAKKALGTLRPEHHRLELLSSEGILVLDDAYNANPPSMREALLLLGSIETRGERRAVLGDMLELGPDAERFHEEVGGMVPRQAWLYAAGEFSRALERGAKKAGVEPKRIRTFPSVPEMAGAVAKDARSGDLVLVKGSRGMRLEQVVERLVPGRKHVPDPLHAAGRS